MENGGDKLIPGGLPDVAMVNSSVGRKESFNTLLHTMYIVYIYKYMYIHVCELMCIYMLT